MLPLGCSEVLYNGTRRGSRTAVRRTAGTAPGVSNSILSAGMLTWIFYDG